MSAPANPTASPLVRPKSVASDFVSSFSRMNLSDYTLSPALEIVHSPLIPDVDLPNDSQPSESGNLRVRGMALGDPLACDALLAYIAQRPASTYNAPGLCEFVPHSDADGSLDCNGPALSFGTYDNNWFGVSFKDWYYGNLPFNVIYEDADVRLSEDWRSVAVDGKIKMMYNWPGYPNLEWSHEIQIERKSNTGENFVITREELISCTIEGFKLLYLAIQLQNDGDRQGSYPLGFDPTLVSSSPKWTLGCGVGYAFEEINLLSVHNCGSNLFTARMTVIWKD